ncbi:MAG: T9SS type A sorting domain-containing protein [Flavobacteriales bacterium]
MKTIFYILIIISIKVSAQVQLPPLGAEWHYSKNANPLSDFFTWKISHDTIVEGKTAKLVTKYNSNNQAVKTEILTLQNDSVFYWKNNQFNLMYDFASQIGDTIVFQFTSVVLSSTPPYQDTILNVSARIVDKQDTIIDGISLLSVKTLLIPILGLEDEYIWPNRFDYIEQIGHDYSGMEVLYSINLASIGQGSRLRCYNNYQNLSYQTPYWISQGNNQSCNYTSFISITVNENIELYPNPTNGLLRIELPQGVVIERIECYDLQGQKVKTHNGGQSILTISDLIAGNYLIKLHTNKGTFTEQVLIH